MDYTHSHTLQVSAVCGSVCVEIVAVFTEGTVSN